MITTFEGGTPAEKSPAEKTPEQIRQEKRGILGMIVNDAAQESASISDINKWGNEVLRNLELFDPAELRAFEESGIKGLETLAKYIDLKKDSNQVRQTAEEIENAIKLFETERKALDDKNGGDFELPPNPDEGQNLPELKATYRKGSGEIK